MLPFYAPMCCFLADFPEISSYFPLDFIPLDSIFLHFVILNKQVVLVEGGDILVLQNGAHPGMGVLGVIHGVVVALSGLWG